MIAADGAPAPALGRFGIPTDRLLRLILVAGVLLRIAVFVGLHGLAHIAAG